MKIDYDERRKNDETFILNLTPGDFELEGTRKIANNRQIKFVLKKHKETYLIFTKQIKKMNSVKIINIYLK